MHYSAVQYSTVQYSTVQYSTVQYSRAQYSRAQYSTVQYSTVQYRTVQYSTVQYSTVQNTQRSVTGLHMQCLIVRWSLALDCTILAKLLLQRTQAHPATVCALAAWETGRTVDKGKVQRCGWSGLLDHPVQVPVGMEGSSKSDTSVAMTVNH